MSRYSPIVLTLPLLGCPADPAVTTGDDSSSSTGEDASSGAPDPTSSGGTTEAPTTSGTTAPDEPSTSTGPTPDPICGNGFVEGDEPCDDGNDEPDDGCNALCERTGVPLWTVSWDSGAKKDDTGVGLARDADGNLYIAGSVEGDDNRSDAVVRKLDPADGAELQQFVFAGELGFDDTARGVAVGEDGSVVLVGIETIVDEGRGQGFARKFDADGATLWTHTEAPMYEEGSEVVLAVAVDADAVYIAGAAEIEKDVYEGFVRRLDPDDGTPVWTVTIEEISAFAWQGLAVTPDGEVVHAAATRPAFDDPATPRLARYTPGGDEVWLETDFDGGKPGLLRGVAAHPDGDLAVVGSTYNNATNDDFMVLRVSGDGELIWRDVVDLKLDSDYVIAAAWAASGDLYVGGYGYVQTQQSNMWIRRYTGDGEPWWTSVYNDEIDLYDTVNGVVVLDDRVVVAGSENVLGSGANQWIRAYAP
jgi:cysteine-rich repeat protein